MERCASWRTLGLAYVSSQGAGAAFWGGGLEVDFVEGLAVGGG